MEIRKSGNLEKSKLEKMKMAKNENWDEWKLEKK